MVEITLSKSMWNNSIALEYYYVALLVTTPAMIANNTDGNITSSLSK